MIISKKDIATISKLYLEEKIDDDVLKYILSFEAVYRGFITGFTFTCFFALLILLIIKYI